jgi:hypothetical protein
MKTVVTSVLSPQRFHAGNCLLHSDLASLPRGLFTDNQAR